MQGFHRERLELKTTLTKDLTIYTKAIGLNGNSLDCDDFEYENTRFVYEFDE